MDLKKIYQMIVTAILILNASSLSYAQLESINVTSEVKDFVGLGALEYINGKIQAGYYVEEFAKVDVVQIERVNKRNGVEEMIGSSYKADPRFHSEVVNTKFYRDYTSDIMQTEFSQRSGRGTQIASTYAPNNYLPHSDGSVEHFKDGLLYSIDNQRMADEFGNVAFKDMFNMIYDENRLLVGYDATITDHMKNSSTINWKGSYTADSVFYGTDDTNANKHFLSYIVTEIDHAGNSQTTDWKNPTYEGKFLRSFTEYINGHVAGDKPYDYSTHFTRSNIQYLDSHNIGSYHEDGVGIDNLTYSTDRTGMTYNSKEQMLTYKENRYITQLDGTLTQIQETGKLTYLHVPAEFGEDVPVDIDRLLESNIVTTSTAADKTSRTENTTTKYTYDNKLTLIGGASHKDFYGQAASWLDASSNTIKDGDKYTGYSDTTYCILGGKPMEDITTTHIFQYGTNVAPGELVSEEISAVKYGYGLRNNIYRLLTTSEDKSSSRPLLDPNNQYASTRKINTTYTYDSKGNLIAVNGTGSGHVWNYGSNGTSNVGWYGDYDITITNTYDVILGKPCSLDYNEAKKVVPAS